MRPTPLLAGIGLAAMLCARPALAFGPEPTAAAARFRFVVLDDVHLSVGDLGVSRAQLHTAIDEINAFAPQIDFVLVGGDLGSAADAAGLQTELQAARAELDRLAVPYHVTIGNRDVTATGDDSAWRSAFGRANYRFTHGGVQFISLRTTINQSSLVIPSAALDSLSLLLSQIQPTEPLVVFSHHPLGPLTPVGVTNTAEFYARVDPYALRAVFNGHWHGVFEEQRNGAWYCTSGALAVHRANHDETLDKGYRLVAVLQDYSMASRFYVLGHPPSFAPEPPVLAETGNRYATPNRLLRLRIGATDSDGDVPTYSATGLPSGATFSAAQKLFSWTPTAAQVGVYRNIRFFAADASGADTLALAVRVLGDGCLNEDFEPERTTWYPQGGAWSVASGEMRQFDASTGSFYCTTGSTWTDVHLEADLQHDSGIGYAGLVFRYQDADNNYYLWNNGAEIQLRRRAAGVVTKLGRAAPVGPIVGWHHVRVEAVGPDLKVYWDGTLRLGSVDSTFASGRIGLVCSKAAARFDNVVATGCAGLPNRAPVLTPVGDRTVYVGAPVTIVLAGSDPDHAPAALAWYARDLPAGAAFSRAAHRFTWTPQTSAAGSWCRVTFGLTDGELDDAETVRFCVLDTTATCMWQTFTGPANGWTTAGGTWSVAGGQYTGTTAATAATSIHEPARLENFLLQTRLRALGTGTASLLFRYVDATHYDALDFIPSLNTVALRKVNGATSKPLASDAEVTESMEEVWHLYALEAHDNRLRLWVDGVLMYDVLDAGGPGNPISVAGRVGLRIQNASLNVDDILVTDCAHLTTDAGASLPRPPLSNLVAYPNPFNPQTTLRFDLGAGGLTHVAIYDVSGRLVRSLFTGDLPAGSHALPWNGRDDGGRAVASGMYAARVSANATILTRKLVLVE